MNGYNGAQEQAEEIAAKIQKAADDLHSLASEMEFPIDTCEMDPDQVEWVVNDLAELGVKIGNRFFFLYKGSSIEYLDDSGPRYWRPVRKREFGEVCRPPHLANSLKQDVPGYNEDGNDNWKELPSVPR